MTSPSSNALPVLQAAFDEVLPDSGRRLELDDDLIDLGIGSIAALEMAGVVQSRLGVEIQDADLLELRTVRDFVMLIERRASGESLT